VPTIRVEAASAVPWSDVEHSLTGGGDGASCWCQWFLLPRKQFDAEPRDELRDRLRKEVDATAPAPGLIAYVDDIAAAWVRVGPRVRQPALLRTRPVTLGSPEPAADPRVWAISCFVVRREFRGLGVAKEMVRAGVEHATSHGARVVEAYPIDTDQRRARANELFVGTVSLFRGQGFVETARPLNARVVMTRTLDPNA
jgi:ribosomal protein S18 acetylase RimI-like enzyme